MNSPHEAHTVKKSTALNATPNTSYSYYQDNSVDDYEDEDTNKVRKDDSPPLPRPTMTSYDPWASSSDPSTPDPLAFGTGPPTATEQDEDQILEDSSLSREQKQNALQKLLFTAASNGDVEKVHSLLGGGESAQYIDVNAKDESGSTALIYSSCFGNEPMVNELLRFDADVDVQDKNEWTALMWAINNHHVTIVKRLIENDASVALKTSTGRSALDFISPGSEIFNYLKASGYVQQDQGDFYDDGGIDPLAQMDQSMDQLKLESAYNLDVDMAHLNLEPEPFGDDGMDDDDDVDGDGAHSRFVWDKVLPDQMFVFNESDIPRILNEAITKMQPQRSHSQKPIPANMIFLSARYALNFGSEETLENLLNPALQRIRTVVMAHKEDLAFLAFWVSNCTLLMYYMRKDRALFEATVAFQERLSELIVDIYVLITQDVERRMDKHLDASILDHDTIPGMESIEYQSEWRIFKRNHKQLTKQEEIDQTTRPPSPKRKAQPSPRNVTSILGSVLFVMDLYDVHPIITQQIISQVLYWLGAALFNRIMSNRKYLARSRAMQTRLNISAIEDWARLNNRRPENSDEFSKTPEHASISEICQRHFTPLIQLLQWLQCFSGFGDDFTNVIATLQQLTELNPLQLLHVANKYRAEVGEKGLSKEYKNYLAHLRQHYRNQVVHTATTDHDPNAKKAQSKENGDKNESTSNGTDNSNDKNKKDDASNKEDDKEGVDKKKAKEENETDGEGNDQELKQVDPEPENMATQIHSKDGNASSSPKPQATRPTIVRDHHDENEEELLLDASLVLPFIVPTLREMIVTYGAGLGGTHTARARKYEPSLPTDFLEKFEDNDSEDNDDGDGLNNDGDEDGETNHKTGANNEPLFRDLAMPQPVHRWTGGGTDPELENVW